MSRDLLNAVLLPEQRWAQDHRSDPGWSYRPRYPNPEVSPGFLLLGLHPFPQFTERRGDLTLWEGERVPQRFRDCWRLGRRPRQWRENEGWQVGRGSNGAMEW